ncbi:MAG: ParB N-terminal domain-containing protein [Sphingopyxis sp.]|uniref:plasmid partitioning protein RepB C-terminal domain-containing protein n=1 Tax=Sphingopyxis sp. TaxID=1908224 RepID=UPI001A4DB288|nr:plasmid partitioning protein RepB C-terminal domain-containing protein [Sphingopyxis sp.]MBL9065351.1 ParB N-terminal domain-containing protein [Sphingopyxis sp.]
MKQAPHVFRAFEDATMRIPVSDINFLYEVRPVIRTSVKYAQIAASIKEVGIIEPPVVILDPTSEGRYRLLDGHLRIDILIADGVKEVVCLIATEDEAFTYNRRLSRIAIIQEHKMILQAVKRGASEERIARALNVNVALIRQKRNLLNGICSEVADLLRDKHVPIKAFAELRRLKPMRQVRAAEMMVAMNRFSTNYMRSIVAATPISEFVEGRKPVTRGVTPEQLDLMTQESERLDQDMKQIEQRYGEDHLDLVLATAYIATLLENARVVRHLAQFHPDIFAQFQKIADVQKAA